MKSVAKVASRVARHSKFKPLTLRSPFGIVDLGQARAKNLCQLNYCGTSTFRLYVRQHIIQEDREVFAILTG